MEARGGGGARYPGAGQAEEQVTDFQLQPIPMNLIEQLHLAVQNNIIQHDLKHHAIDINHLTQNLRTNIENTMNSQNIVQEMHRNSPLAQNMSQDIHRNSPLVQNMSQEVHRNSPLVQNVSQEIHRNSPLVQNVSQEIHRNSPLVRNMSQEIHSNTPLIQNVSQEIHRNSPLVQDAQRNSPLMVQDIHRNTPEVMAQNINVVHDQRMPTQLVQMGLNRLGMTNVIMDGRQQGLIHMPFQIKSEQDGDETYPYVYDPLLQTLVTNHGGAQIDGNAGVTENVHQNNLQTYVFSSHNVNIPGLASIDPYGPSQPFFQSFADSREVNAENLVVNRHYEGVYLEDMKREREDITDKLHITLSNESPSNENINTSNKADPQVQWNSNRSNTPRVEWDKSNDNKIYFATYDPNSENYVHKVKETQNKSSDVAYKSMIEAEYANIKGEYICCKCNGIFPSKRGLKQHSKNCPENNGESEKTNKFSCNQCQYKCQSPAILKIHERTHTGEKPFSCNFCSYKSGQKNNVAKHILVHMKEKPFRCQYCDYRCAQKNNLVVHERTHTGFKPFACTLCDYKTVQKPNLVKHMYLHSGQKPFSCDVCSYKCVQKTNLTKHKLRHLNDKGDKSIYSHVKNVKRPYRPRQKIFKCQYCDYASKERVDYDKHVELNHTSQPVSEAEQAIEAENGNFLTEKLYESGNIQGLNLMKNASANEIKDVQDLCLRKNEQIYQEDVAHESGAPFVHVQS